MGAGRPKVFVDAEAIDSAIELFWKNGYEATSTEQLLGAMKMGKGSMYHNFGGKREVFVMAMNKFVNDFFTEFGGAIQQSDRPVEFIKDFFRSLAKESVANHKKGCFMGNTVAELSLVDTSLEKMAIEKLKAIEEGFLTQLKRAKKMGQLGADQDPKLIARHLINLWNGINITRRMYPDSTELKTLIEFNLSLV